MNNEFCLNGEGDGGDCGNGDLDVAGEWTNPSEWGKLKSENPGDSGREDGGDGRRRRSTEHFAKEFSKSDVCRRCGEEGHFIRDCQQEPKTCVITNEEGKQREMNYVPKELAEGDLFDQGGSSGINFENYEKIQVQCSGENPPQPIKSFKEAQLRPILLENIEKCGYKKPTPVQKYSIPAVLAKRDIMSCAQTGSGKTAAFLLPILHFLLEDGVGSNAGACPQTPQAVVISPTRELASQIKDEARKFASGSVLRPTVIYGGTSTMHQMADLSRGCNVLIATPGRLMDFVERGKVSFAEVRFFVLDEADRMLDMGFMPDVQKIVHSLGMPEKGKRQTLMFSATFPEEIQRSAADFLENYLFLSFGIVGGACEDVTQEVFEVEKFDKRNKLMDIISGAGQSRTLIFVETKKNADFLATFISLQGIPTTSIHGDRFQSQREEALADFRAGRMPILVATAVAARGLDIKDVAHVINYDLPTEPKEYVHRIGRTGRIGNTGRATSFYDSAADFDKANWLEKILSEANQEVPEFLSGGGGFAGNGFQEDFSGTDVRGGATLVTEDDWD